MFDMLKNEKNTFTKFKKFGKFFFLKKKIKQGFKNKKVKK